MDVEDYRKEVSITTSRRIAQAILKVNGTCFCSQCRDKLLELLDAIREVQDRS